MKTSVKQLSSTKVELSIELGPKELDDARQVALTKIAKEMKPPKGFRQGNVPASVAAKHVDPTTLAHQTLEDALSKAVAEAFTAENIQALERPEVDVKKYEPGKLVEFTAEAEVLPEVKLGDYKKLKVKKSEVKITKKDVDEIIERMRTAMAEKKPADRAAKIGDEVVIDFVGKIDGVAFDGGSAEDYALQLGSGSFIPGFEEGVAGKKSGETFDVNLEFPDDYHAAELKGKEATFTTTLKEVKEVVKPELNDEFAAKCGPFTSMDELTSDIKRELTDQREREEVEKLKDDLVAQLVEASEVPVPEVLKSDQATGIERDMTQNLMQQGLSIDQYLEQKGMSRDQWLEKEVAPAAEKRVQAGLVLAELSKVEGVKASTDELDERVQQYASQYGNNPEMAKQFQTPEVRRDIANRLLTEKTVDRLVELNTK